jgi:membrane associated rhomboid family serine protease
VAVLWVAQIALLLVAHPDHLLQLPTFRWGAFVARDLLPGGQVWRALTYSLLDDPRSADPLVTMLSLWFFATPVEDRVGIRGIVLSWLAATLGGAAAILLLSRTSLDYYVSPMFGAYRIVSMALLVRFGLLYRRTPVSFLGLINMKGWHLAAVFVGIAVANALYGRTAIELAEVGSALAVFGVFGALTPGGLRGLGGGKKGSGAGGFSKPSSGSGRFKVIKGGKEDSSADDRKNKKWLN